jgi:protein ImuA
VADRAVIDQLQKQLLSLQHNRQSSDQPLLGIGLGAIENSFPGNVFARAAVHELISASPEDAACTNGFLSVILGRLMRDGGSCVWISTRRNLFPPGLKFFGIEPERIIFVDVTKQKDVLWALEEALKCDALAAVVGELSELSFNDSRRFQLAVENSRVTGFVHRYNPKTENAVACVTRWKIKPLASKAPGNLPGVGFPGWQVQLLKVRNGKPGEWRVQFSGYGLEYLSSKVVPASETFVLKTG